MKSNELRIGNYVRNNFHPNSRNFRVQKVTRIDNPLIGVESGPDLVMKQLIPVDNLSGIELTEHWLVQGFGFIPNNYGGYCKTWKPSKYNDSVVEYRIGRGMNEVGYSLWDASTNGMPEIKNSIRYVHELQNLWYWLTRNEELTLLPGNSLE